MRRTLLTKDVLKLLKHLLQYEKTIPNEMVADLKAAIKTWEEND
jgi:hypothetical protein